MIFDIYNSLIWFVAVSTYQRVEEIILQSHGRPRSSGSESCGSTNDRTVVRPPDQPDRPTSASSTRQNNGGFPAMTSTPGGFLVLEMCAKGWIILPHISVITHKLSMWVICLIWSSCQERFIRIKSSLSTWSYKYSGISNLSCAIWCRSAKEA